MSDKARAILFLTVLSLIVGNVLAGISIGLHDRIENNKKLLRVGSLLEVLQVDGREQADGVQLLELFQQKVREKDGLPRIYVYEENGQLQAYAFEVSGRGLWDKIQGLIAVEQDGYTVRGVRFYEQNETPGLGGEIGSVAFASLFQGKTLKDQQGTLSIVKAGSVPNLSASQVDGITGATMTGDAANVLMASGIEAFLRRMEEMK